MGGGQDGARMQRGSTETKRRRGRKRGSQREKERKRKAGEGGRRRRHKDGGRLQHRLRCFLCKLSRHYVVFPVGPRWPRTKNQRMGTFILIGSPYAGLQNTSTISSFSSSILVRASFPRLTHSKQTCKSVTSICHKLDKFKQTCFLQTNYVYQKVMLMLLSLCNIIPVCAYIRMKLNR